MIVGALGLALVGCGWFGDDDPGLGTCLQRGEADEAGQVEHEPIDCDRPHDLQVVGLLDGSELGGSFPGDTEVSRWAFDRCVLAFEDYVGVPYGRSLLELEIEAPGADDWRSGRQQVRCTVGRGDGQPLVGSLQS
jgi:hypothetical protein